MIRPRIWPWVESPTRMVETLLVWLSVVVLSAFVFRLVLYQRAFLDVYFLPVAWASWRLGRSRGVATAIASSILVIGAALMNDALFANAGHDPWVRFTDLGLWAGFLFLAAYAVGVLAERDRRHLADARRVYTGVLEILAKVIDSIDRSTDNHSRRVAARAIEVGRYLKLAPDDLETLRVAAYLHDIGKVEVSADVLQKAASLTAEERAEIERHVDYGEHLLQRLGGLLERVVPLVLYHHERWDGRGYKGLVGNQIPLGARIIAVCDTYDAIVADRPYRSSRSHEEAMRILRDGRDHQFDRRVVDAFVFIFDNAPPAEQPAEQRQAA